MICAKLVNLFKCNFYEFTVYMYLKTKAKFLCILAKVLKISGIKNKARSIAIFILKL